MAATICHYKFLAVVIWLSLKTWKQIINANPFAHFLSPTKKGLGFAVVVILLDLDRGGSSTQQEHRKPKPYLPSIH